jgi:hypothetical protein
MNLALQKSIPGNNRDEVGGVCILRTHMDNRARGEKATADSISVQGTVYRV